MANLSRLQQKPGELVEQYITKLKRIGNKFHILLPDYEFVKLAWSGPDFELRKKFEGMEFRDMSKLSTSVTQYELLLKKEVHKKNTSFEKCHHDYQDPDLELKVDVAEVI